MPGRGATDCESLARMGTRTGGVKGSPEAILSLGATQSIPLEGMMGSLRLLVADDHDIVRNGVRTLLRTMSDHPDTFTAGVGLHPSFCVEPDVPALAV